MLKKKIWTNIFLIFLLAFFAANLVYPAYFDRGVDFLNSKLGLHIPYFWEKPFKLGLDLQGGAHLIYEADLSSIAQEDQNEAMNGLRDIIERRVNYFGVSEPIVQIQNERLIVELAGIVNVSDAIEMIGQTPFLEFKEPKTDYQEILERNQQVLESGEGELEDPFQSTELTGKYLKRAEVGFDQTTYSSLVSLQFNDEGARVFEELTEKNVGKPIAIYIDNQLISAPNVQEIISGGKAQITGSFSIEETKELVRNLNAGALPIPINLISQQSVGPTLGKISLEQSLKAGLFGFIAVIFFMIFIYRLPGIISVFALSIYVILMLALFKLIPVTLTLAGIGGFILSLGMAVDANILIFSRLREELRGGQNFSIALENGFKRAWPSIRDGNFTTLIVSLILFSLGTSFIKGFAFTLTLGILLSMFSAIVITKNLLSIFKGGKLEKIKWLWK
ncbi:protein translocase subunit SecD [Patescibacteria group bacterium]